MKLLVVEDDPTISDPLCTGLRREGFVVELVETGGAALSAARPGTQKPEPELPDLVLLDLGLPDIDGRVVCRQLRTISNIPIIVVTASGDEIDRVTLLELGADDYVIKPFGFRELVARIRAVLRRTTAGPETPDVSHHTIAIGDLQIDRRNHRVSIAQDNVSLTPKEYDLLLYLALEQGVVRPREQIIRDVWDENWWGSTKTLDVHIASLRKKLGPKRIETIRGVGFLLSTEAMLADQESSATPHPASETPTT